MVGQSAKFFPSKYYLDGPSESVYSACIYHWVPCQKESATLSPRNGVGQGYSAFQAGGSRDALRSVGFIPEGGITRIANLFAIFARKRLENHSFEQMLGSLAAVDKDVGGKRFQQAKGEPRLSRSERGHGTSDSVWQRLRSLA